MIKGSAERGRNRAACQMWRANGVGERPAEPLTVGDGVVGDILLLRRQGRQERWQWLRSLTTLLGLIPRCLLRKRKDVASKKNGANHPASPSPAFQPAPPMVIPTIITNIITITTNDSVRRFAPTSWGREGPAFMRPIIFPSPDKSYRKVVCRQIPTFRKSRFSGVDYRGARCRGHELSIKCSQTGWLASGGGISESLVSVRRKPDSVRSGCSSNVTTQVL
jgi:hypothetical protein